MSLRFCANLNFMFQESSSLLERYSLAKKAGFSAVECATPYDHRLDEILAAKEKAGVEQVLINSANWDGVLGYAAVPGKESEFTKSMDLTVKYAKALNCKRVHVMSGKVPHPSNDNHNIYLKNLKYAATLFERENIIGLIEPINNYSVPNYYMNSYERALNVIENVGSPSLKLQLDLFHLQHLSGNLTHNIKNFFNHVGHIQIAQVPNRNEPDTPGEIDYRYIFDLLEKQGYAEWIGLEYKPSKGTEEGLGWLKKLGYNFQYECLTL